MPKDLLDLTDDIMAIAFEIVDGAASQYEMSSDLKTVLSILIARAIAEERQRVKE